MRRAWRRHRWRPRLARERRPRAVRRRFRWRRCCCASVTGWVGRPERGDVSSEALWTSCEVLWRRLRSMKSIENNGNRWTSWDFSRLRPYQRPVRPHVRPGHPWNPRWLHCVEAVSLRPCACCKRSTDSSRVCPPHPGCRVPRAPKGALRRGARGVERLVARLRTHLSSSGSAWDPDVRRCLSKASWV